MTQPEYEQKKSECFVKFCKGNGIDQEVNISIFDAFNQIFDRAYTLGKQEKDAKDDRTLKVNRQLFCRLCSDADDYINEHLKEEDSDYTYYQGRSDALHELYRGECKDADTVTIKKDVFDKLCKYSRYVANWVPYFDVCPICGEYNQRGCICVNCYNDKNWNNGE